MTMVEMTERREPTLDTVEVILKDGHLESRRDIRSTNVVLQQIAERLTQDAIRQLGWTGRSVLRAPVGRFYIRAFVSRPRSALVINVYDSPAGRRLVRQAVPLLSAPEFSEGSLVGRAKIVGAFLAGAILVPISEEAVQKSRPGHAMVELETRIINAVDEVAEDAAKKALADLELDGDVQRHGKTLSVTLSLPPGRSEIRPPSGPGKPSKKKRGMKPKPRR